MKLNHITLIAALTALTVFAAPTYELVPGVSNTSVILAPAFVSALNTLKVTPGGLEAGNLAVVGSDVVATFPIPSGRVDTSNLRLQILHTGGLSLRAGSTFVTLSDFIVENLANGPRLTGLVRANETVVGRVPLFNITLSGTPEVKSYDSMTTAGSTGTISIKGKLLLTDTAAGALNGLFGVSAFTKDFVIGDATVAATYIDGDK